MASKKKRGRKKSKVVKKKSTKVKKTVVPAASSYKGKDDYKLKKAILSPFLERGSLRSQIIPPKITSE